MAGKEEKIKESFEISIALKDNSRVNLRNRIIGEFLKEKSGFWKNGKKHVTLYKYFVETLSDGRRIYLLRPTFLNKGIDFQVWVENLNHDGDGRPSHKDVFEDLNLKKAENPKDIQRLIQAINRVWSCEEPEVVLKSTKISFRKGFTVEMLLKILKWLFIEQDVTYWNYDGRGMLRLAINEKLNLSVDSVPRVTEIV